MKKLAGLMRTKKDCNIGLKHEMTNLKHGVAGRLQGTSRIASGSGRISGNSAPSAADRKSAGLASDAPTRSQLSAALTVSCW